MNYIKHLCLIVAAAFSVTVSAQTQWVHITKTDGSEVHVNSKNISSFSDD